MDKKIDLEALKKQRELAALIKQWSEEKDPYAEKNWEEFEKMEKGITISSEKREDDNG